MSSRVYNRRSHIFTLPVVGSEDLGPADRGQKACSSSRRLIPQSRCGDDESGCS